MILHEVLKVGEEAIGRHEAKLLLSHISGLTFEKILLNNQPLDALAKEAFLAAVNRRKQREPLQYILGRWEFMGLPIITDPRALIPRPETELMVERVLACIHREVRVLDLCTGSGCIAVAIAKLSKAEVTATDISLNALSLAAENIALNGLDGKINLVESDLFEGLKGQTFDIIITNPPYIPTHELLSLQPEIKNHEPTNALDGGYDGMDIYRRLIPQSLDYLNPGGKLFLEIGPSKVKTIMEQAGYGMIRLIQDYAGLDRILEGQKLIPLL